MALAWRRFRGRIKSENLDWEFDEHVIRQMAVQVLELGFLFGVVACLVLAATLVRQGPPNLLIQRVAFLIAIAACVTLATGFVRWQATLELGERKWEMESSDRTPLVAAFLIFIHQDERKSGVVQRRISDSATPYSRFNDKSRSTPTGNGW